MSDYNPFNWERQYGREDVDYHTWYSPHAKRLAIHNDVAELKRMLVEYKNGARHQAMINLNSNNRAGYEAAQSWNATAADGDQAIAIRSALEIHELFPEHAAKGD